ncbi:MAG: hypothetical protein ACTSRI_04530 [Promethearchaeota archaeon]
MPTQITQQTIKEIANEWSSYYKGVKKHYEVSERGNIERLKKEIGSSKPQIPGHNPSKKEANTSFIGQQLIRTLIALGTLLGNRFYTFLTRI